LVQRSTLLDAAASLSERLHPGRVVRLTPEDEFFVLFGDGRVRDTLAGPGLVELRVDVAPRRAESGEGFELPTFTFAPRGVLLGSDATLELAAALGCALQEAAALAMLGIEFKEVNQNGMPPRDNRDNRPPRQFNNQNRNHGGPAGQNNRPPFKLQERKHSGPSPLLKDLLQKIGVDNKQPQKLPEEIKEVKVPTPAPVSLSTLKKPESSGAQVAPMIPTKEASEEKKASLKDLLAKVTTNNQPKEEKVPEPPQATIPNVTLPKVETPSPKPEVKPEPQKQPEYTPTPAPEPQPQKNDSWQKPKPKNEVPEDVLRKVLE
jgi:hypothetical protein